MMQGPAYSVWIAFLLSLCGTQSIHLLNLVIVCQMSINISHSYVIPLVLMGKWHLPSDSILYNLILFMNEFREMNKQNLLKTYRPCVYTALEKV